MLTKVYFGQIPTKKDMFSYWEKNFWFQETDFCIVGSGYVGLLSSIFLKQKYPNKRITLLDSKAIPQGASTKNAGFCCFGSIGELWDDLETVGEAELVDLIRLRYNGLKRLEETISFDAIDFQPSGGEEVFTSKAEFDKVAQNLTRLNAITAEATGIEKVFIIKNSRFKSNLYPQVIENKYEGQLNPVKLLKRLQNKAKGLGVEIHYGSALTSWNREGKKGYDLIINKDFSLKCNQLLLTTNAFTAALISDLDIQPKRNQVHISAPMDLENLRGTFHNNKGYLYFRNVGSDRLLIGGARDMDPLIESTIEFGANRLIQEYLVSFVKNHLDMEFQIDQSWSGIIATGNSKFPIIRKTAQGPYVAARLGGMGVATGAEVAKRIVDLV